MQLCSLNAHGCCRTAADTLLLMRLVSRNLCASNCKSLESSGLTHKGFRNGKLRACLPLSTVGVKTTTRRMGLVVNFVGPSEDLERATWTEQRDWDTSGMLIP